MSVIGLFKKNGGFSLIKKYVYNHVLLYAIFLFMVVPKNRVGLELFREAINGKFFFRLEKKYKKLIESNKGKNIHQQLRKPKIIWFCWFQGIENAPILVKKCFSSIKSKLSDYDIKLLTSANIFEFAILPDYIIEKWQKGIISDTHFSDILRNNVLVLYGGTWIDATVLLTSPLPVEIEDSDLFFFQTLKPGSNGKAVTLSSWFISSIAHNPVLELSQILLFEYWKDHTYLCDYFLFHIFTQMALNAYPEYVSAMPKYTNETPHLMLFELANSFNLKRWNSICNQIFCHKLTYKLSAEVQEKKGTFYQKIMERE